MPKSWWVYKSLTSSQHCYVMVAVLLHSMLLLQYGCFQLQIIMSSSACLSFFPKYDSVGRHGNKNSISYHPVGAPTGNYHDSDICSVMNNRLWHMVRHDQTLAPMSRTNATSCHILWSALPILRPSECCEWPPLPFMLKSIPWTNQLQLDPPFQSVETADKLNWIW